MGTCTATTGCTGCTDSLDPQRVLQSTTPHADADHPGPGSESKSGGETPSVKETLAHLGKHGTKDVVLQLCFPQSAGGDGSGVAGVQHLSDLT